MQLIVITPENTIPNETLFCNLLLDNGLEILHLRKPGADKKVYEHFIKQINPRYHNRIVIHDHYELAAIYGLKGIHLKSGKAGEAIKYAHLRHVSISCHSFEEINDLPFDPAYCFISPVFDSISKKEYYSRFTPEELSEKLTVSQHKIVALGGITPANIDDSSVLGFYGIAVLGYIWQTEDNILERFFQLKTPTVISIAGFDPSAGAGVMADIKTFESCGTYGRGITSAITFQNESEYTGTHWIPFEEIRRQCELQFRKSNPRYIKIGLIENFETLAALTEYFNNTLPDAKIIWDPVLKASSGFVFHNSNEKWYDILSRIFLITPNTDELHALFGETIDTKELQDICRRYQLNILWKGGHNQEHLASDRLITETGITTFSVQRDGYGKHGTGCILSSAITAFLAQSTSLPEACNKAQLYVSGIMNSNDTLLGYHFIKPQNTPAKPHPATLNLQYITDHKEGMTVCEQIEAVCKGGIRWVQLRMKETDEKEMLRIGRLAKIICQKYNTLLIIDDNVMVARQLDADGVHLGKDDMSPSEARRILGPDKLIGLTCNTYEDIAEGVQQPIDYIGLGPFTYTTTKKKLSPVLGLEGYRKIIAKMHETNITLPVYAIGGITENDFPPLMKTGIQGVALSGLIKNAPDLTEQTKKIIRLPDLAK